MWLLGKSGWAILALQNKLPTLTPVPRYTHPALWWNMKLWKRLKVDKASEIVRENAYDTVSRARWVHRSTRLRSFTRLKARERFRRLNCAEINPSRTRNNVICISYAHGSRQERREQHNRNTYVGFFPSFRIYPWSSIVDQVLINLTKHASISWNWCKKLGCLRTRRSTSTRSVEMRVTRGLRCRLFPVCI